MFSIIKRFGRAYRAIFMDGLRPDSMLLKITELPVRLYRKLAKQYHARKIPDTVLSSRDIEAWVRTDPPCRYYLSMRDWRMPAPVKSDEYNLHYDIDKALELYPGIAGVAMIFFCGIGDYLYMTPAIESFRRRYSQLKLCAFASSSLDNNNSPLVYDLLKINPNFDSVFQFNGYPDRLCWKNYNYDDAIKSIPPDYLVLPMIYRVYSDKHRIEEIYETLNVDAPVVVQKPKLYLNASTQPFVMELADSILHKASTAKGICFIQFDARSSGYIYPYSVELAEILLAKGYVVITASQQEHPSNPLLYQLDFKKFSIIDSFELLATIKGQGGNLKFIGCNSMSWALSGALDIPFLSVQIFQDESCFSLWFPNIKVITPVRYTKIPVFNQFVECRVDVHEVWNKFGHTSTFFTYRPETMAEYFELL